MRIRTLIPGRIRRALVELTISDEDAAVRDLSSELADGCLAEIGEALESVGCCHGHNVGATPPMFYPEMIACAVQHARRIARP